MTSSRRFSLGVVFGLLVGTVAVLLRLPQDPWEGRCVVLTSDLALTDEHGRLLASTLPVGTKVAVLRADAVNEVQLSVRLPEEASVLPCETPGIPKGVSEWRP